MIFWDFPGSPAQMRLQASNAKGTDLLPGQGTKILYATQCGQKIKTIKIFLSLMNMLITQVSPQKSRK